MSVAPTPVQLGRARHRTRSLLVAIVVLLLGAVAVALVARSDLTGGSGDPATQRRALAPFASVDLAGSNNVVRVSNPSPAIAPPRAREPVSPMMMRAGAAFHQRKPAHAPNMAAATIAWSRAWARWIP